MMKYRDTEDTCLMQSLPDRFELIRSIKALNKKSKIQLTPKEKELLEYYVSLTRPQDWMVGARPICYQNLTATAEYFGVTERAVQYIETALLEKGFITYSNDGSGSFRRYGARHKDSGHLMHACGVNLAPLAHKQDEIKEEIERQKQALAEKATLKRFISNYRGKISMILRDFTCEDIERAYDELKKPIRAYMPIDRLNSILNSLKALYEQLRAEFDSFVASSCGQVKETSSADEENCVKLDSTNIIEPLSEVSICSSMDSKKISSVDTSQSKAEINLTTAQVYLGSSDRFKKHFDKLKGTFDECYIQTAKHTALALGVTRKAWLHAEKIMSPTTAAVCMALIDEKLEDGQQIRDIDLYLYGMVNKFRKGKLNLIGGILGACERQKAFA